MILLDVRDLTPFCAATQGHLMTCSEAASTMLWKFHKAPRTPGGWDRDGEPVEVAVLWNEPDRNVLETYGNEKDATEYAAYAVAIALADHLGFKVLGRSSQRSGSDWVMIPKGEPTNDYYRLEVSGMARIHPERPEHRLAAKLAQLDRSQPRRPGVAVVARFEDMRILSETRP